MKIGYTDWRQHVLAQTGGGRPSFACTNVLAKIDYEIFNFLADRPQSGTARAAF